jgi:hypothetical protein
MRRSISDISSSGVMIYNDPPRIQLIVNFKDIRDNELTAEFTLEN